MSTPTFPHCELHNIRCVYQFPQRCPFGRRDVNAALLEFREEMWWDGSNDAHRAVAVGAIYETCSECISKKLAHPHTQYLRRLTDGG